MRIVWQGMFEDDTINQVKDGEIHITWSQRQDGKRCRRHLPIPQRVKKGHASSRSSWTPPL